MSIEIKNVYKKYGKVEALNDVNLTLDNHKIYGLLGRNGAGKSTLMNIISNRTTATEGEVLINGQNCYENNKAQSYVFLMNDKSTYPTSMKIIDAIKWTKRFYPDADIEKGKKIAELFGLDIEKRFGSLSTGYRTIAKFVLAVMSNAEYTLLDEPVLGLDASHREILYKTVIEDYMESEKTYVIATHIIEEISNVIEHIVVIDNGKVIEDTDVENLLSNAYSVSGNKEVVNQYISGKDLISTETLGAVKTAYLRGKPMAVPEGLETGTVKLQKLFVKLTDDKEEIK